ncbi:membrane protein UL10 [Panine betaherpesvirus 2]|uniref:Membrane protein UL10 n=1 Tax=Panine betaherpesvirus 2 TaxID=188763 RepID=Q8QS76_9BETA|nr:membrane protein UL10 [Panine betaherpesvirus 2]AAM00661.1 membrane protein UL10 [Panine betaherpesvirus 2]QXV67763.1 membrane protein UL10 [Panine betaherpesvirus 2]
MPFGSYIVNCGFLTWFVLSAVFKYEFSEACEEHTTYETHPLLLGGKPLLGAHQTAYWYKHKCDSMTSSNDKLTPLCYYPPRNSKGKLDESAENTFINYLCSNSTLIIARLNLTDAGEYCRKKNSTRHDSWPTMSCYRVIVRPITKTTSKKPESGPTRVKRTTYDNYSVTLLEEPLLFQTHRSTQNAHIAWLFIAVVIIVVIILFFFKIPQKLFDKWKLHKSYAKTGHFSAFH